MTIKHKLVEQYNQPGNVLMITNYPPRGEGVHTAKIGGVAGFAKNTLLPLAKKLDREDRKIIVLADVLDTAKTYEEDGMLVIRGWKRNSLSLYWNLLKLLARFDKVDSVLIEFEFASYGDFWVTSLFPLFIGAAKILGKHVTIVLHQVITDLSSLLGHLGLHFGTRQYWLFATLLPLFYRLLTHTAGETIVLEEFLRKRLTGLAPMRHVTVIPHGIETKDRLPSQHRSRSRLGIDTNEFVILSFGFITWYKGTDLLLKAFNKPEKIGKKSIRLIIAGGPSMTQQHKAHYQAYFDGVTALAKGKPHITMTGFVPNNKLDLYFAAADLVVLPYRTVMSSSGPFSLALAHQKPLLISEAMKNYTLTDDVVGALAQAKLSPKALLLPNDLTKLPRHIETMGEAKRFRKIRTFVKLLAQLRSFSNCTDAYYTVLTQPVYNAASKARLALS
jgi:glycosyltransferase involved in cell wall biosynthesis